MSSNPGEIAQLLAQIHAGNKEAEDRLIPLVYTELGRLAAHYLRGERSNHILQPTALVHEAYLNLTRMQEVDWQGRLHFFAIAATALSRNRRFHLSAEIRSKLRRWGFVPFAMTRVFLLTKPVVIPNRL